MPESSCHAYWTTECKTAACGGLLLAYIGPSDNRRIYFLPQCKPFDVTCPECKKTYTYVREAVTWKNIDREPGEFVPNQAFLEAIRLPNS